MSERSMEEKAVSGDDEAFVALLQLHKEDLLRTAYAFLKNEHEALEALQEITYRAYKKIHTLKEPSYAKTWLIRIMINYCQDLLKKNKRLVRDGQLNDVATSDNLFPLEMEQAMAVLSLKEQRLVYLKYFQDVNIKEIADIEKIPEGTVKSRLHKVLRTLRHHFEEKGEIDHV